MKIENMASGTLFRSGQDVLIKTNCLYEHTYDAVLDMYECIYVRSEDQKKLGTKAFMYKGEDFDPVLLFNEHSEAIKNVLRDLRKCVEARKEYYIAHDANESLYKEDTALIDLINAFERGLKKEG